MYLDQLHGLYVHDPQDVFSELLVPVFTVDANRMKVVVCYSLAKCLSQFTENRKGLLLKSSFVTEEVARALIDHGYKYLSQFGYVCPVQVSPTSDWVCRKIHSTLMYDCICALCMFAYAWTWSVVAVVAQHEVCTYICTCPTACDHFVLHSCTDSPFLCHILPSL